MKPRLSIPQAYLLLPALFVAWILTSCIGTDVLDIEPVDPQVKITVAVTTIEQGTSFDLEAVYFNEYAVLEEVPVTWTSSSPGIISIDPGGQISAIMSGSATITASVGGYSDMLTIVVTSSTTTMDSRSGTFTGSNGYAVSGSFTLSVNGADLVLSFNSDFSAQNGPGLYVYLSNFPDAVTGGVEVAPLEAFSGTQQYDIPSGVQLGTYDYVIILCKPFNIPFGYGELL